MTKDPWWMVGEEQPLKGHVAVSAESWDTAALDNREAFELSLGNSGLPTSDVKEALELRDTVVQATE